MLFSTLCNDLGTIEKKKKVILEAFLKMAKNPIDLTHENLTVGSTPTCTKIDKIWMHFFFSVCMFCFFLFFLFFFSKTH